MLTWIDILSHSDTLHSILTQCYRCYIVIKSCSRQSNISAENAVILTYTYNLFTKDNALAAGGQWALEIWLVCKCKMHTEFEDKIWKKGCKLFHQ